MLMCRTTLRNLSFEDFVTLYAAHMPWHQAVEVWLRKNLPTGEPRPIPYAYLNRADIPDLAELEVLA